MGNLSVWLSICEGYGWQNVSAWPGLVSRGASVKVCMWVHTHAHVFRHFLITGSWNVSLSDAPQLSQLRCEGQEKLRAFDLFMDIWKDFIFCLYSSAVLYLLGFAVMWGLEAEPLLLASRRAGNIVGGLWCVRDEVGLQGDLWVNTPRHARGALEIKPVCPGGATACPLVEPLLDSFWLLCGYIVTVASCLLSFCSYLLWIWDENSRLHRQGGRFCF